MATARQQLADLEARIADLVAQRPAMQWAARLEEAGEKERSDRVAWEREVTIGADGDDVIAMATWPISNAAGSHWYVGAGVRHDDGRTSLLVVWKIQTYRGDRLASLVHGDAPDSVRLDVFRHWRLTPV